MFTISMAILQPQSQPLLHNDLLVFQSTFTMEQRLLYSNAGKQQS